MVKTHQKFIALLFFAFQSLSAEQSHYKLYCMYTPHFEKMYAEYFLPSLKDDFEIIVETYPQECPSAAYRTEGWDKTMLNKLKVLKRAVLENWGGKIFFYSDVDIIFLKPILETSLEHLGSLDFVVQQGWPRNKLCAGFFVMRGNERTLQLINAAYDLLEEKVCIDDQVALQKVLDDLSEDSIAWKLLPSEQYPNGRRVLRDPLGHYAKDSEIELPDEIILFHANCCIGLEHKYDFLQRVQHLFGICSMGTSLTYYLY